MNAHARGVALLSMSGSTEKVPLNLIEVILAQGSSFKTSDCLLLWQHPPCSEHAHLPIFCSEQIDGKDNFIDSQQGVDADS